MVDTKPPGVSGGKVEKARGARVVKRWRSAQPHQSSTALKPANTLHLSKDDLQQFSIKGPKEDQNGAQFYGNTPERLNLPYSQR